ncbi:MAG: hypothetical protein HWE22_17125 [Flavobacteriales bacterium]|nr:hypothetical protein [Flavobacteriales bacterium]
MNKIHKALSIVSVILLISCSISNDEPLNAITDLKKFRHSAAKAKYQKVVPINKEDLYGDWTLIGSFFTIKESQSVTTFGIEGRKFSIKENGSLIIDNSALTSEEQYRTFNRNWTLKSNNTVFDDGQESYHVRIKADTMEWIEQTDEDYMYFVLVK